MKKSFKAIYRIVSRMPFNAFMDLLILYGEWGY